MAFVNEHYLKLTAGYLFPEIDRRVGEFKQRCPEQAANLINGTLFEGAIGEPVIEAYLTHKIGRQQYIFKATLIEHVDQLNRR